MYCFKKCVQQGTDPLPKLLQPLNVRVSLHYAVFSPLSAMYLI